MENVKGNEGKEGSGRKRGGHRSTHTHTHSRSRTHTHTQTHTQTHTNAGAGAGARNAHANAHANACNQTNTQLGICQPLPPPPTPPRRRPARAAPTMGSGIYPIYLAKSDSLCGRDILYIYIYIYMYIISARSCGDQKPVMERRLWRTETRRSSW